VHFILDDPTVLRAVHNKCVAGVKLDRLAVSGEASHQIGSSLNRQRPTGEVIAELEECVFGNERPHSMAKSKHKRTPKTVLKLPDLEQSKSAVMNSLTSASSKRSYDHAIREFIDWYC
jgi:hypothetical protein